MARNDNLLGNAAVMVRPSNRDPFGVFHAATGRGLRGSWHLTEDKHLLTAVYGDMGLRGVREPGALGMSKKGDALSCSAFGDTPTVLWEVVSRTAGEHWGEMKR